MSSHDAYDRHEPSVDDGAAPWEVELADLLADLSEIQGLLLGVLAEKRQMLAGRQMEGPPDLQERERELTDRLRRCHDRRGALLREAGRQGFPDDSIASLARSLPAEQAGELGKRVKHASDQMRLLRHESLTQWVVAQRSLLHVSQMLEIIATGGRLKPTYGPTSKHDATGGLVDRAA